MVILGIDPGLAATGYGIIEKTGKREGSRILFECINYGVIKTEPSFPTAERLKKLSKDLNKLIRDYQPKILAVESIYFFKNLKTALPVSQAKGVILLSAANKNIPVYEFTPLQVKMAITGYGRAEKKQIQKIVQNELNLKNLPRPDDASDALAIAICCGNLTGLKGVSLSFQ